MVLDPIRSLGHGRSLWTNWRWTNFSLSYQLPLHSKGRPRYPRNLKLIYMGLCEPRVVKSLVDLLYTSRLPKVIPHINFWVAHVVLPTLLRRLHFSTVSPRVTRWMDGVASLSTLRHVSFPEWVMSLRCPYFWALYIYIYIYICILSFAPHILNNSLPANSSKILV